MAHFGMDRGGSGGYGHDFSELITMASGNPSTYGGMQRVSIHCMHEPLTLSIFIAISGPLCMVVLY